MKTISLNGEWLLRYEKLGTELKTMVPGSALNTLLKDNIVPDPFYGTNEHKVKEMLCSDFTYTKKFDVPKILCEEESNLIFEGIDTIASIFLNGNLIANTNDMHRTHKIKVSGLLKESGNELCVKILSSLDYINNLHKKSDIFYASTGCTKGNGYLRKAHYMFGWDWGPVVPDAGIFRPVRLEFSQCGKIEDFVFTQTHENGTVTLQGKIIANKTPSVTLISPNGACENIEISNSGDKFTFSHFINNPQIWWPNGYGAQPLYTLKASVTTHEISYKIGIRELYLSTETDEWGKECAFCVNGVKIFAMGANYIPQDNIIPRVNRENTQRLIADCAKANFNCIRVWGGGYYPDDYFYDLCDEYGIIVWQDLMFACNVYDLTDDFEQNILAETKDNVIRLRHHACIGVWCGNNEMEWGWRDWGRLEGHRPKYKADYIKIFEMLLPRLVQSLDTQNSYWLSSPSSGGSFDDPNDFNRGDNHYWEVWHSGKPFTEYKSFHFRFCSEFGFQSFPEIKTIREFCPSQEENIFSRTMENHQKNGMANQKIFSYVSEYFRYPKNMECIAYISQILQLKAIQYGVEHWRRNFGRCMGSLYWQLNDCWPVASWASIDYYGRWKALHYGAKRFYSRVTASACEEQELSGKISYFVHNESLNEKNLVLKVLLKAFDLKTIEQKEVNVSISACSVKCVCDINFEQYLCETRDNAFAEYILCDNSEVIASGVTLFAKPKHINFAKPNIKAKITQDENGYIIELCAESFAHYVQLSFTSIDCIFSDNYFDITDTAAKIVRIDNENIFTPNTTLEKLNAQLNIMTVADSY